MDHDLRLINKIRRGICFREMEGKTIYNVREFGETTQESFELWTKSVKPSEEKYIIPTRKYADLVITNNIETEREKNIKTIIELLQ
jgi:uridine kinase